MFLLTAAPASAATITFDPTDVLMQNSSGACTGNVAANTTSALACESLSFLYTLSGFSSATDTITSGTLSLFFYDDNTPGPDQAGTHTEQVNVTLDGLLTAGSPLTVTNGSTSGSPFSPTFTVMTQLQSDGQLSVLLATTGANSDFFFARSTLAAEWRQGETEELVGAPEPASMVLLGTGLAALAFRRYRSRKG